MSEIGQSSGYFRSFDGTRLYYYCEGPKDAPVLLFCYGLVCSKLHWKYQMEYFKQHYRVMYMDYRAHGKSDNPDSVDSMTIENFARDLAALHDELGLKPVAVLGHSLGVNILLEFYRLFPEKVQRLVLANGTPKDPFETMFHHNFLQILFPAFDLMNRFLPQTAQKLWSSQGANPINQAVVARLGFNTKYAKQEDINEYLLATSAVRFDLFLHLLQDFTNYDACYWLDQVKVPTLVIGGEKDLITPVKNQRVMHELIPNSAMVVVEEGSHCPQMEKIDEVNAVIEKFIHGKLATKPARKTRTKPGATAKSARK